MRIYQQCDFILNLLKLKNFLGSYEFEKIDSDCKLKKYYYRTLVRSPQTIINARENKKESEKEVIYKPLKYLMDTYVLNKDAQLNIKRYEQSSNHSLSKGTIVAPQNELVSNTSQFLATGRVFYDD